VTLGQFEKAKLELETIVKATPDAFQPLSLLGIIYNKLGKVGLAKDFWLKAQQINPRDPVSKAYLALTQ
jgi:Flp pilus assembly protein TadD